MTTPTPSVPYPPRTQAFYVALVLFIATAFSYLDGQVLGLLVAPIRQDLGISDTAFSALYGLAFVVLCSTIGVPIGRMVDNHKRRRILVVGILIWSLMTMACGLAGGFWSLFAARAGAGIGMACLSPLSVSLLADCFPPHQRTRALNVFLLGVYAGQGLSLAIGGALFDGLSQIDPLPVIGHLAAWRQVFILVGLPGLLLALIPFTMIEPARQEMVQSAEPGVRAGLLGYMRANVRALAPVFVAEALLAFVAFGLFAWAPTHFMRAFGLGVGAVGQTIGLLLMGCGSVGAIVGSIVCDRWMERRVPAAKFLVTALGLAVAAPGLLVIALAPSAGIAFGAMALCLTAMPFASIASRAMVQELFPNQFRGQGSSIALLLQGLAGTGCGPIAVAMVSDHLNAGPRSLGYAIAIIGVPGIVLFVVLFLIGRRSYEATRSRLVDGPESTPEAGLVGLSPVAAT